MQGCTAAGGRKREGEREKEGWREKREKGCDLMSFDSLVFGIESVEALLY